MKVSSSPGVALATAALIAAGEAPVPVSGSAAEAVLAPGRTDGEEAIKAIGPLRVELEMFNIFLNEADEWSRRICWTSLGTGEVTVVGNAAKKLVGISQRRTREFARFQTQVHLQWRPELVAALTAAPRPTAAALAGRAATLPGVTGDQMIAALLATAPL